jgi:hypothetical protein
LFVPARASTASDQDRLQITPGAGQLPTLKKINGNASESLLSNMPTDPPAPPLAATNSPETAQQA